MKKVVPIKSAASPRERFEATVSPHFDALYAAARRMTMSAHDAEDLVQEVCIKALKHLDELEQIEYVRAWLLKVMYHQFVDQKRRAANSPVDMAWTGEETSDPDELASVAAQPDEATDRERQIDNVLRAMRCLPADQCALVAMHDVEGLSIDELSQLTGMPEGTVKAKLHRTRKKLGRLLQNDAITKPHLRLVGAS